VILKNRSRLASTRMPTGDVAKGKRRLHRIAASVLALASFGGDARADGFDARIYRPSSEANGVGTIDGVRAPDAGVVAPSIASDISVAPVTLEQGAQTNSVIQARWVVEPQLSVGIGSSFGLYARTPIIAGDWGRDVNGAPLPTTGILPPSLGILVPITRNPLNDGRFALRAEVAAPIGSTEQFSGDGQVTARGALTYGGYWHRAYVLTSTGGQLAPIRGVGDAQIGRALTSGVALRLPITAWIAAFGSADARFDIDVPDQSSGLVSLGAEVKSGHSIFRLLGSAGIRDVIGTPRAMVSLAWSFDVSAPPAFMQSYPAEPTAPAPAIGASSAQSTGTRAQL
jgi:hypothetical protein